MSNPYFKFKKFIVWHDKCAMKVGTDGVLLGAWASASHVRRVLDVGTGTGLIALMVAQRFEQAKVIGIEVDESAFFQACDNVNASAWSHRIEIVHADFRTWKYNDINTSKEKYDLIVSNPPYFVDALRSPSEGRSLARHASQLNYESLFGNGSKWLTSGGRMCVIVPAEVVDLVVSTAVKYGLNAVERVNVYSKQGKPLKRVMLAFCSEILPCQTENLFIMNKDGSYSLEYCQLTADFYLKL